MSGPEISQRFHTFYHSAVTLVRYILIFSPIHGLSSKLFLSFIFLDQNYVHITCFVAWNSVVGLATSWTVRRSNPGGGRDIPHPSRLAVGPTQPPVQWLLVPFLRVHDRGVALSTHFHLASRLKSRAFPLLPSWPSRQVIIGQLCILLPFCLAFFPYILNIHFILCIIPEMYWIKSKTYDITHHVIVSIPVSHKMCRS